MSVQAAPLPSFMIPENAPFSPEQRVWLSGFLAAAIAPHAVGVTPLSDSEAAALVPGLGAAQVALGIWLAQRQYHGR